MSRSCAMCMVFSDDDFYTGDYVPPERDKEDVDPPNCQHPTSQQWHRFTKTRKTKELRAALALQAEIETATQQLKELISTSDPDKTVQIARLATQLASSVEGLGRFCSQISATSLYNERRADAGAARRAFAIPEILERILSFLSEKELLLVQRVDKTMYASIEGSIVLSRKLHLSPNATGFLETPFAKPKRRRRCTCGWKTPSRLLFPGFKCYSTSRPPRYFFDFEDPWREDDEYYQYRTIVAEVLPPMGHSQKRSIGDRCRKMLICQPAPTTMQVYPQCCGHQFYEQDFVLGNHPWPPAPLPPPPAAAAAIPVPPPPPPAPVFVTTHQPLPHNSLQLAPPRPDHPPVINENGLTVGDLYNAAEKVRKLHRLCPFAAANHHDCDGFVRPTVTFACLVKLNEKDPLVKPYNKPLNVDEFPPPPRLPQDDFGTFPDTINRYINAKRDAYRDGLAIPTLEEFKASGGAAPADVEPSSPDDPYSWAFYGRQ